MKIMKVTCVSKFYSRWHYHLSKRFIQAKMELDFIYIDKLLASNKFFLKGNNYLLNKIVNKVIEYNSKYIIYDLEFIPLLTAEEILLIAELTKTTSIGLALDDDNLHYFNKYIYKSVDKIFASSPLSEMNYKSLGIPAHCFPPLEIAALKNISENSKRKQDYILVYGDNEKADRKKKINEIKKNNFKLKILEQGINYENLYEEIAKAKLVINFSKAKNYSLFGILGFCPHSVFRRFSENNKSYIYQAKGRIFEAGYLGTACISEYFPMHAYLASNSALPTFTTTEEMISLISKIMKNTKLAEDLSIKLNTEIKEKYNESILAEQLINFMKNNKKNCHINNLKSNIVTIAIYINKISYSKNPFIIFEYIYKSNGLIDLITRIINTLIITQILLINCISLILKLK